MKITDKLEMANKLQECEKIKGQFQKQLSALESNYFKSGVIFLEIKTADFQHKGTEEFIEFDAVLMVEYIKKEIEKLQVKSNELIEKLSAVK